MKLVSLNLEGGKHIDKNLPWLKEVAPDVVCFQECIEPHFETYKRELGMEGVFVPMCQKRVSDLGIQDGGDPESLVRWGIAILSRHTIRMAESRYLIGSSHADLPLFDNDIEDMRHIHWAVARAEIEHADGLFIIATTHLPKAPNGNQIVEIQHETLTALLQILDAWEDFVLCGDFNAPRGGEIFAALAEKCRDNIPAHYTTSIDNSIHRAGHKNLQFMVDGLFTTPQYAATNVELVSGLSDHCAVIAHIAQVHRRAMSSIETPDALAS